MLNNAERKTSSLIHHRAKIFPSNKISHEIVESKNWTITEPYDDLNGGDWSGNIVPFSPDPLITYQWSKGVNQSLLQVYYLKPISVSSSNPTSFINLDSLLTDQPSAQVVGKGSIRFDFGVESAAWFEFQSPDLDLVTSDITLSISEYNQPGIVNAGPPHPIKTLVPKQYGSSYRLELNSELYEGVRFAWIHVNQQLILLLSSNNEDYIKPGIFGKLKESIKLV